MALIATEPLPHLDQPPSPVPEDARSFASIYREHSKAMYYLSLRLLGNPQRAEDAVHDVFLKAFRALDKFRDDSQIRTWLYRIAINHCQNLRKTWHQRHIVTTDDHAALENALQTQESPLRVTEVRELGERIQKTLDALPGEYRLILLLVADEALSYEEVAALTHQTPDSVRGKLYRARKAFTVEFQKTA